MSPARRLPHGFPAPVTIADAEWDDTETPCSAEPDMWFATDPDGIAYAKSVCARCPMRDACLRAATTPDVERYGVWGGTTPEERLRLTRNAKRPSRAKGGDYPCRVAGCSRTFASAGGRGHHEVKGHTTHCVRGHALEGDNLAIYGGARVCVTCNRQKCAERRARVAS